MSEHPYKEHLLKNNCGFYFSEAEDEGCDTCGERAVFQTCTNAEGDEDSVYLACEACVRKHDLPLSDELSVYFLVVMGGGQIENIIDVGIIDNEDDETKEKLIAEEQAKHSTMVGVQCVQAGQVMDDYLEMRSALEKAGMI